MFLLHIKVQQLIALIQWNLGKVRMWRGLCKMSSFNHEKGGADMENQVLAGCQHHNNSSNGIISLLLWWLVYRKMWMYSILREHLVTVISRDVNPEIRISGYLETRPLPWYLQIHDFCGCRTRSLVDKNDQVIWDTPWNTGSLVDKNDRAIWDTPPNTGFGYSWEFAYSIFLGIWLPNTPLVISFQ